MGGGGLPRLGGRADPPQVGLEVADGGRQAPGLRLQLARRIERVEPALYAVQARCEAEELATAPRMHWQTGDALEHLVAAE